MHISLPSFQALFAATLLLSSTACTLWDHSASETRTIRIEVQAMRALACVTHNGGITVTAGDADVVEGVATVTAWAESDARAKADLPELEIVQELSGGELRLSLRVPEGRRGDVAFELRVPKAVELVLTSHNGAISAVGIDGVLRAESHNGEIGFGPAQGRVEVTTYNGAIHGRLGAGPLDGAIRARNGLVELGVDPACSTRVSATTRNGAMEFVGARDTAIRDGHAEGVFGKGEGRLEVATHNGALRVRPD